MVLQPAPLISTWQSCSYAMAAFSTFLSVLPHCCSHGTSLGFPPLHTRNRNYIKFTDRGSGQCSAIHSAKYRSTVASGWARPTQRTRHFTDWPLSKPSTFPYNIDYSPCPREVSVLHIPLRFPVNRRVFQLIVLVINPARSSARCILEIENKSNYHLLKRQSSLQVNKLTLIFLLRHYGV